MPLGNREGAAKMIREPGNLPVSEVRAFGRKGCTRKHWQKHPGFRKRRPGYFFRRGKDENEKQIKNYINNLHYFFIYTDSVQQ
ncbi:hypothetical protein TSYNTROPHJE_12650 [Tepidanaerobacter syntrophicus]|nr:hypothetical protein TSYNTROPHJE_12650 [Tepidanaerobacter syntrophicus]